MISISFILGMVSNQSQGFLGQWLQAIDIADVADIADATTYVHWSPTLSKLNNPWKIEFQDPNLFQLASHHSEINI